MELSTPHSDQPLLLGLTLFQHPRELEHVRTIHFFKKGWCIHRIQQEFLLSNGWSCRERSAPLHLACQYSEGHVKAHMDTVRAKQESESWKCLLDFCSSSPRILHSGMLESLSLDTLVANVCAKANVLFMNANNAHENHAINWEQPQCVLPSLSACLQYSELTEHKNLCESPDTMSQRLQLDLLWQQWGSDLELASPKIMLNYHNNDANTALYRATPSPTSSSLSNTNVVSSSWTHKSCMPAPIMLLNVMEEPRIDCGTGRNATSFMCTLMPPNSDFESKLRESCTTTNSNIFGTMPFEYGITQPMSSTSVTCSSSDERSLEAVNSRAPDQPEDDWRGRDGFPKSKESTKHTSSRPASRRPTELTKDELTHYFNMPITQASKELKVGLTVLKKLCRVFGIPRWPHRKMKSINSLINNIQDLSKGNGDTGDDVGNVQVAVEELEKQKKEMQESPGIQLAEKTKRLRQACFKASYRKRRQAHTELYTDDRVNAAIRSSNSNNSNNSSCSDGFYHYCEYESELPSVQK